VYKTVVVGTDGSGTANKAAETAANLAREWGSALHIVVAYSGGSRGMGEASGAALVDSGGAIQREAANEVAAKASSTWAEGLDVTVHAVGGHAADAIVDTADSVSADLIVVGSKGMQGARRFLGSVPNSVAHTANCAVLIVKTG
jgi:nucleotide-binding universal stress UspA family protein